MLENGPRERLLVTIADGASKLGMHAEVMGHDLVRAGRRANGDLPPIELEQAYYRRYPQLVPSG